MAASLLRLTVLCGSGFRCASDWQGCDVGVFVAVFFFFSSRRRHTRCSRDWSSDVCSSDLVCRLLLEKKKKTKQIHKKRRKEKEDENDSKDTNSIHCERLHTDKRLQRQTAMCAVVT